VLNQETRTYQNWGLIQEWRKLREEIQDRWLFYSIWYYNQTKTARVEVWDAPFQGRRLQRALLNDFDCPLDAPDLLEYIKLSLLLS
jgi:hypothetical protein